MTRVGILDPSFLLTQKDSDAIVRIQCENDRKRKKKDKFTITWSDLEYKYTVPLLTWIKRKILAPSDDVSRSHVILKGVDGSIVRGELVGVLGPSGSGKSTFLETVIGRRPEGMKGSVMCESRNKVRISFIPQSNQLFEQLTVRETIEIAHKLFHATSVRVSRDQERDQGSVGEVSRDQGSVGEVSRDQGSVGEKSVAEIVQRLSLDSCYNNPVKKCSGGQLKRLAIACDLIRSTDVLVMDEPTSGLDSASTESLIEMLAEIVKDRDVSMILTIHQPSYRVLRIFDTIYTLSCEGKCLYSGPPDQMLPFLASNGFNCPHRYNPADFIIDIASGNFGLDRLEPLYQAMKPVSPGRDQYQNGGQNSNGGQNRNADPIWASSWDSSGGQEAINMKEAKTLVEMIQYDDHPFLPHFSVLMKRSLLVTLKNPWLFALRLASQIIFAFLIGAQMTPIIVTSGGCPYFPAMYGNGGIQIGHPVASQTRSGSVSEKERIPRARDGMSDGNESTGSFGNIVNGSTGSFGNIVNGDDEGGLEGAEGISREFDPSHLEAIQESNKVQEDAIIDFMGILFLILVNSQFGAILPTILTMPLEVRIVMKERRNDWYSVSSYYWAKVIADIPFQLLFPVVNCLILFSFAVYSQSVDIEQSLVQGIMIKGDYDTGIPSSVRTGVSSLDNDLIFRYLMITLVSIVFVLTAQAHGVLVGVIFIQSATVSAYIGIMSMIPFILFSGFLIRVSSMTAIFQFLSFGTYFRYRLFPLVPDPC